VSTLALRLAKALSQEQVESNPEQLTALRRDICRFELGAPLVCVKPRTSSEVAEVVRIAAEFGVPIVPFGKRSAYWRPLRFKGAIALSLDGLHGAGETRAETQWFGAGTPVRQVHEFFLTQGKVLGCHPDAYGDTSIGAMVATGFKSGCGMGAYTLADIAKGIRVVGAGGQLLETGVPGLLEGVEAEAFFGSSGTLGIITEVAVKPQPRCSRALVHCELPAGKATAIRLIGVSQRLKHAGFYETYRAVEVAWDAGDSVFEVDMFVRGPEGSGQLDERITEVESIFKEVFPEAVLEVSMEAADGPETLPRWWGEAHEHWEGAGHQRYSAVDVNLAYSVAPDCLDVMYRGWDEAKEAGATSLRLGMYMAPGFLNLGLHVMYPHGGHERFEDVHDVAERTMNALLRFPVQPYACRGRAWPTQAEGAPADSSVVLGLKRTLDPKGLLHPGAVI
jgi:FAD/FMN-containing dehydrogenase